MNLMGRGVLRSPPIGISALRLIPAPVISCSREYPCRSEPSARSELLGKGTMWRGLVRPDYDPPPRTVSSGMQIKSR